MSNPDSASLERYAARLLFQYRVETNGKSNKRRLCEERIIVLRAECAKDALEQAKNIGCKAQHSYENAHQGMVNFEFVGVIDLLHLGVECEENEVWYEITERLQPMERRDAFIPTEDRLNAIAIETVNK